MHTLHVCSGGDFHPDVPLDAISDHLANPEALIWLDLLDPDPPEVALLRDEFGFHPLAIEDAVRSHERPKVDSYPGYYLFIFYSAAYNGHGVAQRSLPQLDTRAAAASQLALQQGGLQPTGVQPGPRADPAPASAEQPQIDLRAVSIFAGRNFIVTVHGRPVGQIAETIERWRSPAGSIPHRVGAILHALLDAIVDDYFSVMDQIVDWVEDLEDTIFSRFRQGAIQEIFALKKDLLMLRRVVAPERDVLNVLLRQQTPIFRIEELAYLQDVYDHLVRVTDTVDTYRDLLSSALDSYLSLQSNQLNQLVKTLTLSSIILMACTLVAGIYGMNFANMPELNWQYGYPFALGLMVAVGVGLALYFRSRKWW